MLQFRTLAIGRERDLAAPLRKLLENIAHTGKRLYATEVLRFINPSLGFKNLFSRIQGQLRRNELKSLVPVQSGVKLEEFISDGNSRSGQGLL